MRILKQSQRLKRCLEYHKRVGIELPGWCRQAGNVGSSFESEVDPLDSAVVLRWMSGELRPPTLGATRRRSCSEQVPVSIPK